MPEYAVNASTPFEPEIYDGLHGYFLIGWYVPECSQDAVATHVNFRYIDDSMWLKKWVESFFRQVIRGGDDLKGWELYESRKGGGLMRKIMFEGQRVPDNLSGYLPIPDSEWKRGASDACV